MTTQQKLIDALDSAIKALNVIPSFDTKIEDERPGVYFTTGRGMSSYKLISKLEKVLKEATTHEGFHPPGNDPIGCRLCREQRMLEWSKEMAEAIKEDSILQETVNAAYQYLDYVSRNEKGI